MAAQEPEETRKDVEQLPTWVSAASAPAVEHTQTFLSQASQGTPPEEGGPQVDIPPGSVFGGRYRAEATLGRGGMGLVLRATDLATLLPCALKLMLPRLSGEKLRATFESEFSLISRLRHPGIPAALGYGFHSLDGRDCPYVVLELVSGRPFTDVFHGVDVTAGPGLEQLCDATAELVHILCYLHERGIVHRDVKPANILLSDALGGPRVRLLDFGISSVVAGSASRPSPGEASTTVAGTLPYMAPELFQAQEASPASDLYAVGVLLYASLTGELPFDAHTATETLQDAQPSAAPSLTLKLPEAPSGLPEVVAALLEKDPVLRPTGLELLAALGQLRGTDYQAGLHDVREAQIASCPLVGREDELAWMEAGLLEASQQGQVRGLVGPAGMGKSRLLHEFGVKAQLNGWRLLTGSAYEQQATAYEPLLQPLRGLLSQAPADTLQSIQRSLASLLPELGAGDGPASSPQQVRADVARFILSACAWQRTVLVLENLHWADRDTLELLEVLVHFSRDNRTLVLLSGRPGPWEALLPPRQRRALDALGGGRLEDLVSQALLGPAPPALLEWLRASGAHTPFELIHLLRACAQEEALTRDGEGWRFQPRLAEALPRGIEPLLERRLRRLPEAQRELLAWLTVLERPTRPEDVGAMAALALEQLEPSLKAVLHQEWVARGLDAQQRIVIRPAHDLIRQACARLLRGEELRGRHLRAGEHFAQVPEERLRAAWHLARAGEPRRACGLYELAAQDLLSRQVNASARAALEASLELSRQLGEQDATLRRVARPLCDALLALSELEPCRALLDAWLASPLPPAERAAALLRLGECRRLQGELASARQAFDEALALCRQLGDAAGEGRARNGLGDCERFRGQLPGAMEHNRHALALFARAGEAAGEAYALSALGSCCYRAFDFEQAARHHARARELYRALGDRRGEGYAANGLGECARMQWDFEEATRRLQEAWYLFRSVGDRAGEATAHNWLGAIATSRECFEEAHPHFRSALTLFQRMGNPNGQAEVLLELGHLEAAAAHVPQALGSYQQCADLFAALDQLQDHARALRGQALVMLQEGTLADAVMRLTEGLDMPDGEWPDHAEVYTWLAVLAQALGQDAAPFLTRGLALAPRRLELRLLEALGPPGPPTASVRPTRGGFEASVLAWLRGEAPPPELPAQATRRERSAWALARWARGAGAEALEACRATQAYSSPWYVLACLKARLTPYGQRPLPAEEVAETRARLGAVVQLLAMMPGPGAAAPLSAVG